MYRNNIKKQHTETLKINNVRCKHERDTGVCGSPHPRGYIHQSLCYIDLLRVVLQIHGTSFACSSTNSWHILCLNSLVRNTVQLPFSLLQGSSLHTLKIPKLFKSTGILQIVAGTFLLYPKLVWGMCILDSGGYEKPGHMRKSNNHKASSRQLHTHVSKPF